MFHLPGKLSLAGRPFKPISSTRINHGGQSLFQARFSAVIGCQSADLSSATHQAHKTQIKLGSADHI